MKLEFVCGARQALKMWSIRLAAVASAIVAFIVADPTVILTVVGALPPSLRTPVAMLIGVIVFIVITVVRLARQRNLPDGNAPANP